MPFQSLGLAPALLSAVDALDFHTPTPIQQAAIPAILAGGDVLGMAQTGSGKTAAFALPLLQRWLAESANERRTTLILVPTHELAVQVGDTLSALAQFTPRRCKVVAIFGGVSINPQMMALRGGADFVIATPGRLLDLVARNACSLADIQTLVLDEADRLLDLGFAEELQDILRQLPAQRQNLFFSATFPTEVTTLADSLLNHPTRIVAETESIHLELIEQRAIRVEANQRTLLLRHLLKEHGWTQVLVFVATQYAADHVTNKLLRAGIQAAPFHGEFSQGSRQKILAAFKEGQVQVVVATDLAARGLDIEQLPAVVNYDLPRSPVDYTHRIGRTGRAGHHGTAISFITPETEAHFRLIEKRQGIRLAREEIAGFVPRTAAVVAPSLHDPDSNGGIKGKRKSKKDKLREAAAKNLSSDSVIND